MIASIAGYMASLSAMLILLPQVIKTLRTGSSRDLSVLSLFLSMICNICWFVNAYILWNPPLMLSALVIIFSLIPLFLVKLKNAELFEEISKPIHHGMRLLDQFYRKNIT